MLRFITDAPTFWVRELVAFARGVTVEDATWDGTDAPAWAESVLVGTFGSDIASIINAIKSGGFRAEGWKPKPATADPTFALAAARIDRERGGSAPASAWLR